MRSVLVHQAISISLRVMRRQDIRLLAAVRQGDIAARCEVGRRYLSGGRGFPRHVQTGLDYLNHPSVRLLPEVAQITVDCLPLEVLLTLGRERDLQIAAASGSRPALLKLGVWQILRDEHPGAGLRTLRIAADGGLAVVSAAINSLSAHSELEQVRCLLVAAASYGYLNPGLVSLAALRSALVRRDIPCVSRCLSLAMSLIPEGDAELADLVIRAVQLSEETGEQLKAVPVREIQACLETVCSRGNRYAAFVLGRALCGVPVGDLPPESLVVSSNLRRASALLLQSADAGCREAWLHLYRLHLKKRSSIGSAQMARFFLEKAATAEITEAQRILGARILMESRGLFQSERGIQLLSSAATRGDNLATQLLCSLVLPIQGADTDAQIAIAEVGRKSPWMGTRLQLARDFGLTKLEALTVNPAEGARPWGLVVGRNPFISQSRLSAPRAIPALSSDTTARLRSAAGQFSHVREDNRSIEGDLQQRSRTLRLTLERLQLEESMFFADASSEVLDTLRLGNRWAIRVNELLSIALGGLEGSHARLATPRTGRVNCRQSSLSQSLELSPTKGSARESPLEPVPVPHTTGEVLSPAFAPFGS
jgi:hypothetical protein